MSETGKAKEEKPDLSGYVGVSPEYRNYADDRNKPFTAEEDKELVSKAKAFDKPGKTDAQLRAEKVVDLSRLNVASARRGR